MRDVADQHGEPRENPIVDVIGAGFGRTGTASLKVALEHLGLGPCHHMFEVVARPELLPRWERAVAGEDVDWDEVLDVYRSTVDWPGCTYWRELMDAYPHAKVILTVRDPDRWYDSAYNTIYQLSVEDSREDTDAPPSLQRMRPMVDKLIWEGTFDGRFDDRAHAIEVFAEHNTEVQRRVPSDRLLVYQVDLRRRSRASCNDPQAGNGILTLFSILHIHLTTA